MTYKLNDIRSSFLDFFEEKSHKKVASAPLIPDNDPTLMFVNAGMVPFKDIFQSKKQLTDSSGNIIKRAVSSQKCVRAGGKHNDLENVGYTARHHTFFEMLGNFSFADYFKEEAILYAYEFVTKTLGLPKDKLLATVYHTDDEAHSLWKKIAGFSEDKIIRIATKDNFWAMGNTGPCGPCSEIFYDHGDKIFGGPPGSADEDGDRFVEIWNLVFMQYERDESENLTPLPAQNIDTGMGLERIAAILQGKHNNYDVDLFQSIIANLQNNYNTENIGKAQTAYKVIADHLRCASFLIADGILPENEGRGYVLRRIMRRAMRYAHTLNEKDVLLFKNVSSVTKLMGEAYPELNRAEKLIIETIKQEEERFKETLDNGIKILSKEISELPQGQKIFSGEAAFKLYDTYGFPIDITKDILKENNLEVDEAGFEEALKAQKQLAKQSWKGSGASKDSSLFQEIANKTGSSTTTKFYDNTELSSAKIIALADKSANSELQNLTKGQEAIIITNETCFYAESGGQAGDKGLIKSANGFEFAVEDTLISSAKIIYHIGKVISGSISLNDEVSLTVNTSRRTKITRNHSATHLLHAVLRKNLGNHIAQKGSLVEEDYLRFDFSHQSALTPKEITKIEDEVNSLILNNKSVSCTEMPLDEAYKSGAVALFGEKYGEKVRVVAMGDKFFNTELDKEQNYSVEFCGGIHVKATGDIGSFKIIKESAVSAGVRRLEAITGNAVIDYLRSKDNTIYNLCQKLKTSEPQLEERIEKLSEEKKKLEKELENIKRNSLLNNNKSNTEEKVFSKEITGSKSQFIVKILNGVEAKDLRGIIDKTKESTQNSVILLISEGEGKVFLAAGVTQDIADKLSAVDFVRRASELMGGKGGGGRADFAQGGAVKIDNKEELLKELEKFYNGL